MNEPSMISAEDIGAAALYDPQIRVPGRPRLRRGLVIDCEADQVVVTGGPRKQLLRGRTATELLPRLFELLDGTSDHATLAAKLEMPVQPLFKVLSLLWTTGVVEEAAPDGPAPEIGDGLADFLSRMSDSTGANPAWEQAAHKLAAARVEIFGEPEQAALLMAELAPSMPARLAAAAVPDEDTTLAVWIDDGAPGPAASCWERGIPLLRLRVRGRTAVLGPLVDRRMTACLACGTAGERDDAREPGDGDHALAVALLARDLFALISRSVPGPLPMRWRSVDLRTLEQSDSAAATRPGCPTCSVAIASRVSPAPLAARYEAAIGFPPKEHADLKAHQMHYKPSNLALQRVSRSWPVARPVELPAADHQLLTGRSTGKLDADRLSVLLSVTAGTKADTPQRLFRWTASGGNIGSVVAYVAVRDVPGLDPGLYGYAPTDHRLAWLSPEPLPGDTPATLILTGDVGKVARKYGAFALRITLLDGGCAQATCRLAARTLGVGLRLRPRWDDDAIAGLLGIDPDLEPVTAVIDLGGHR